MLTGLAPTFVFSVHRALDHVGPTLVFNFWLMVYSLYTLPLFFVGFKETDSKILVISFLLLEMSITVILTLTGFRVNVF